MAKLSDICSINMGQSPDSSSYNQEENGIPFFQGNADFGVLHPTVRIWCNKPTKIAKCGDILISVRAPIGAMNIADRECCIGRGLAALTVDETICYKQYFWHALSSQTESLIAQGTGSTFKAISKKVLADAVIPLPSLERQKEVASVLDKVSSLISLRKQQLEKLDELVKARFVEMFGDPVENPYNFDTFPLGSRCDVITGNTPPRDNPAYYGSHIEWIKSDNINTPGMYLSNASEYLSREGLAVGRSVDKGSILMTCIAGSLSCIGNVGIANRGVAFNQQINAIVPTDDESMYIYWLMKLSKPYIHSTINMALKGILSKGKLIAMEFPFPPIKMQREFALFVKHIEETKSSICDSLNKLETLKNALMQEYFGS